MILKKSIRYHTHTSHPFVERLIEGARRELLDQTLSWTSTDLESKPREYRRYFKELPPHSGLGGVTPLNLCAGKVAGIITCRWKKHCRGLFELPIAA